MEESSVNSDLTFYSSNFAKPGEETGTSDLTFNSSVNHGPEEKGITESTEDISTESQESLEISQSLLAWFWFVPLSG